MFCRQGARPLVRATANDTTAWRSLKPGWEDLWPSVCCNRTRRPGQPLRLARERWAGH